MTAATNTTLGEVKLAGDLLAGEASAPTLRPSGVKSGTYNVTDKVYVDAQGRVTWVKQLPEDFDWPTASKTTHGIFQIGKNVNLANDTISVPKATTLNAGVVKLGANLTKNETNDAIDVVIPTASTSVFGVARPDNTTLEVDVNGTLSVNGQGFINAKGAASNSNLGGVKVGTNFAIASGVLSTNFPVATDSVEGLVKAGSNFVMDGNILRAPVAVGSTTAGLVGNENEDYYIDPATGAIGVHQTSKSEHGHVWGVSGSNIYLNNTTHTLSCDYSFGDFSGDATTSVKGKVQVGDYIDVDGNGVISVPLANGTTRGVFKVTGRNFKIINNALTWDTNFHADTTYLGHARPDNTTITLVDGVTGEIAANFNAVANASYGGYGFMQAGSGINISSGVISVPDATDSTKGVVQIGSGLAVNNGVVSVDADATTSSKGIIKTGSNITNTSGTISIAEGAEGVYGVVSCDNTTNLKLNNGTLTFEVDNATTTEYGVVKPDNATISINNNILFANMSKATASTPGWVKVSPYNKTDSQTHWTNVNGTLSLNSAKNVSYIPPSIWNATHPSSPQVDDWTIMYDYLFNVFITPPTGGVIKTVSEDLALNNGQVSIKNASNNNFGVFSPGYSLEMFTPTSGKYAGLPCGMAIPIRYRPSKTTEQNKFNGVNIFRVSKSVGQGIDGITPINVSSSNIHRVENYSIGTDGKSTIILNGLTTTSGAVPVNFLDHKVIIAVKGSGQGTMFDPAASVQVDANTYCNGSNSAFVSLNENKIAVFEFVPYRHTKTVPVSYGLHFSKVSIFNL